MRIRSSKFESITYTGVTWILGGVGFLGLVILPCGIFGAMIGHTPVGTWDNPAWKLLVWSYFTFPLVALAAVFCSRSFREPLGKVTSWILLCLPLLNVAGAFAAHAWVDLAYDGEFLPAAVEEDGPAPWISPGTRVDRYVRRHQGKRLQTRWDLGNGRVLAAEFCQPLHDAIGDDVWERLLEHGKVVGENGNEFQRVKFKSWATIVSLQPDVVIIMIRPVPESGLDPFDHWRQAEDRTDFLRALLHPDSRKHKGVHPGGFSYHAGTELPASDECYFASTDPHVGSGRLSFDDDKDEIPLLDGRLVLTMSGDTVTVIRE